MTPAIVYLKKQKVAYTLHEYVLTHSSDNYGQDVADALNVSHERLFKTLLVSLNGDPKQLAVCIIPVSATLNLKAAAAAHGAKKAQMADPALAEKITGYVVGGISPFGQKKRLPMVIDDSALYFEQILTSAGKRGLQIEFAPQDLIRLLGVKSHTIRS
ncbi:Cys-tRNA(Pro) deacylase [Reinekea sp. G2M2-21]|uniref:Cys-tRNA(Pro) deacylase n=1 Tax=Reinekea sp. G2M2-21 TaxID=2788942 RepID=UPI0018AA3CD0|nr:Cys-tRNA(Pro) deacylase [Reinekea sp. G2M2-21]